MPSKKIYFVQKSFTVTQPNDANDSVFSARIDLMQDLSQQVGKTLRQGKNVRIVGAQLTVRGKDGGGDVDTGFGVVAGIEYCPTTSHSRKAWNQVFQQWAKQKKLAGAVGSHVKYDDFEVGYNATQYGTRTSTIRGTGLTDTNSERIVLYGNSAHGAVFSLQDYYNSANQIPDPSVDHFDNSVIKEPKHTNVFPEKSTLYVSATHSSMVDVGGTPDYLGGGIAMNDFQFFPADNHIEAMCGVLYVYGKVTTPDTAAQIADELYATVTIAIEGWSPLVYKRRSQRSYKRKYTPRRRMSYGKRRRRSKRRY